MAIHLCGMVALRAIFVALTVALLATGVDALTKVRPGSLKPALPPPSSSKHAASSPSHRRARQSSRSSSWWSSRRRKHASARSTSAHAGSSSQHTLKGDCVPAQDHRTAATSLHAVERRATATKIVFIKTHSTGSSTLTNILHRICDRKGLQCFVPGPKISPGSTFFRRDLNAAVKRSRVRRSTVDIWPNHAVFEPEIFDRLVPNSTKISIFRDPVARVVSSYGHSNADYMERRLRELRANISDSSDINCGQQEGFPMARQIRTEDFHALDFVALTEEYELSLVLLRRLFGWDKRDIVYLRLKPSEGAHVSERKKGLVREFTEYLLQPDSKLTDAGKFLVHTCIRGDEAKIYRKAKRKFAQQLAAFGKRERRDMYKEAKELRQALSDASECCDATPKDSYCAAMKEDNVDWVTRHQSDEIM